VVVCLWCCSCRVVVCVAWFSCYRIVLIIAGPSVAREGQLKDELSSTRKDLEIQVYDLKY